MHEHAILEIEVRVREREKEKELCDMCQHACDCNLGELLLLL